jgi:hypothetical protein
MTRLGYLPARDEHQYIPGASQNIGGRLSIHYSDFITHTEPDAKAEKRRYMSAARSMTPPPNDSFSNASAFVAAATKRQPLLPQQKQTVFNTTSWF